MAKPMYHPKRLTLHFAATTTYSEALSIAKQYDLKPYDLSEVKTAKVVFDKYRFRQPKQLPTIIVSFEFSTEKKADMDKSLDDILVGVDLVYVPQFS
jgi:hypothetical protein